MSHELIIPAAELNEWLGELKPYQRDALRNLDVDSNPEEAVRVWLSATGSGTLARFGASQNPEPYWDRLKDEFNRFVCDGSAYVVEKEELAKQGQLTKAMLVSALSAAIGATIGTAATLVAPAIVVLLWTAGKMGVNAYCRGLTEEGG